MSLKSKILIDHQKILCIGEKSNFDNDINIKSEISYLNVPFKFSELKERAENLFSSIRQAKNKVKKFIYASTMYVYSSHGSFYRATKQAAEIIIETYQENYGIDYVFLRYGSLYGPRSQNWNGIRGFIQQVIENGFVEYSGNGSEVREYIHVLDAANLSTKILDENYKNKAVTITGQQSIKVSDIFAIIFEIAGKEVNVKYLNDNKKTSHYGNTPYRYTPKTSMKVIPTEFVDLGQGLLNIFEEIHKRK